MFINSKTDFLQVWFLEKSDLRISAGGKQGINKV